MSEPKRRNLVPLGILLVILISIATAGAYRDQLFRTRYCQALYSGATTTADSAAVDSVRVPSAWTAPGITCGDLRDSR